MELDPDTCYRALVAHDARFDGVFFVAVASTGIYCRPVCRARTPARTGVRFYRHGIEAERDGYRPCLRCRPEVAPGYSSVDARSHLVHNAVARIHAGVLNHVSVDELAASLGVTARHLRRAMQLELGVTPVALAQSRRLAMAKQLLHDTGLSMAEIAFASGFSSVRRFNALFHERFGRAPSSLRRSAGDSAETGSSAADESAAPAASNISGRTSITLRLDYREPFDWAATLAFLRARAIAGVEAVVGETYRRTVRIGRHTGWVSITDDGDRPSLAAEISLSLSGALMQVVARLRALFDLDADPSIIADHLSADALLAPLVARRPGLRIPGAFDGFEVAIRAILGQQITVRAASTLSGRLAATFGQAIDVPFAELHQLMPTAEHLAAAEIDAIQALGMPRARALAVHSLAAATASGSVPLESPAESALGPPLSPVDDIDAAVDALVAVRGIGPWTAQYIAMRVLRWPDAFPAGDLVLRQVLARHVSSPVSDNASGPAPNSARRPTHKARGAKSSAKPALSSAQCASRAQPWRPWRAYAAMHIWQSQAIGETT